MIAASFVQGRGDLVWLQFNPQASHEQTGYRPALVISPGAYNRRMGLALCRPITSQVKGYPFEVALPDGLEVKGVILSDQPRSLDWRARKAKRMGRVPSEVLDEAVGKILAIVDPGQGAR